MYSCQTEHRPFVTDVFDELAVRFILNQPDATFASAARLFFQLEQVVISFYFLNREKSAGMALHDNNIMSGI